jgi:hypothetical protein
LARRRGPWVGAPSSLVFFFFDPALLSDFLAFTLPWDFFASALASDFFAFTLASDFFAFTVRDGPLVLVASLDAVLDEDAEVAAYKKTKKPPW